MHYPPQINDESIIFVIYFTSASGYLYLAAKLQNNKRLHGEAFNFGPNNNKNYSVIFLVKIIKKYWSAATWGTINKKEKSFYESNLLKLNSNKAKKKLKWKCILSFQIYRTLNRYIRYKTD